MKCNKPPSVPDNHANQKSEYQLKPGDWRCAYCDENNFASRTHCMKCNQVKSTSSFGVDYWQVDGFGHNQLSVEVKNRDWICSGCQELNFASNKICRKCNQEVSSSSRIKMDTAQPPIASKPGDWTCSACLELNFARNKECRTCGQQPSGNGGTGATGATGAAGTGRDGGAPSTNHRTEKAKPGDWLCKACPANNFASRVVCFKCGSAK